MNENKMGLDTFQFIIYSLVKQYVTRQQLVLDAMSDLRPDLLIFAKGNELNEKIIQKSRLHTHVPQRGTWDKDKEWAYFIHGRGCRLIHTVTQEPLEWDAPDIQAFDRFWFVHYLHWWLSQNTRDDSTTIQSKLASHGATLQDSIFDTLDTLQDLGLLARSNPSNPNKFTLV